MKLWGLFFAAALAFATQGCSIPIDPTVHVDQPIVQVNCIELVVIVDGTVTERVTACDAGTTPSYENDAGDD